jgi:transcriptional regulator with XRE-family HTH domain
MGRPEIPVDQTVPQRAALAQWLRRRRDERGLTYMQMAATSRISAATLKRAASGQRVPKLSVVKAFVLATTATANPADDPDLPKAMERAEHLWAQARYASQRVRYTTPGHYRVPDPSLIDDRADLSRALRELHAVCGAPTPYRMQILARGYGILPAVTARRILEGRTLPGSVEQLAGFLRACGVDSLSDAFRWWIAGFERAMHAELPRMDAQARFEQLQFTSWEMSKAA